MSITEAAVGQPLDASAETAPQLTPATWLPLTSGDAVGAREQATPEHGWPGSLFIFLSKLASWGMGIGAAVAIFGAVILLLAGEWSEAGLAAAAAVGLTAGCAVQGALARHVSGFTRWGWYGAMAELTVATLSKVNVLITEPSSFIGAGIGIAIDLLWMRYFWERRADFDIDLSL